MAAALRDETRADTVAIHALIQTAFLDAPHRSGTEAFIVDALRGDDALSTSIVAVHGGVIVGHAAASPVHIDGHNLGWHGLGPVSALPAQQGIGIGQQLVDAVRSRLRVQCVAGCVVLGDPAYYGCFGFHALPRLRLQLRLASVSAEYFQSLPFGDAMPEGVVTYAPAFDATA